MKKSYRKIAFILALMLTAGMLACTAAASEWKGSVQAGLSADGMIDYLDEMIADTLSYYEYEIHDNTFSIAGVRESKGYIAFMETDEGSRFISVKGNNKERTYIFYTENAYLITMGLASLRLDTSLIMTMGMTVYYVEGSSVMEMTHDEVSIMADAFRKAVGLD